MNPLFFYFLAIFIFGYFQLKYGTLTMVDGLIVMFVVWGAGFGLLMIWEWLQRKFIKDDETM